MDDTGTALHQPTPSRPVTVGLSGTIGAILLLAVLALNGIEEPRSIVFQTPSPSEATSTETPDPTPGTATPTPTPTPSGLDADQPIPTASPGELDPTPVPPSLPDAAPSPASPGAPLPEPPGTGTPADPPAADPPAAPPPAPDAPAPDPDVPAAPDPAAPADPAPLPGDPADDTPPPSQNPLLPVGTCLVDTTTPTTVASVTPSGCDTPHTGEVYASVVLPIGDGAAFPGTQDLADQTRLLCQGPAYGEFVGLDFSEDARFLVSPLFPTEQSWAAGDRDTACYLYDVAGPRTGSARGSGR